MCERWGALLRTGKTHERGEGRKGEEIMEMDLSKDIRPLPAVTPDAIFDIDKPKPTLQDVLDRIRKGYYVPGYCLKAVVGEFEKYHRWHLASKARQREKEEELQERIEKQKLLG